MNKINRFLLMLIAMTFILLAAVGIDRGMDYLEQKRWESERAVFQEESRADIVQMQAAIQTLSENPEALTAFLEENGLNYTEAARIDSDGDERGLTGDESVNASGAFSEMEPFEGMFREGEERDTVSGNAVPENTVSGNTISGNSVSGNSIFENEVSGNGVADNTISGNAAFGNTVSGNTVSGNTVSGNAVFGNDMLGNWPSGYGMAGNTISSNRPDGKVLAASYEKTVKINRADRQMIQNSAIDFSEKKIVCLGDSITEASNLENLENYQELSYPYQLGQILGAKEVVNLGIGGSSIGRYWDNAFVDRYQQIPADADIIIVMGGTNDGFCASEAELGTLEERAEKTFTGDLDALLRELKSHYPDAEIILATPLSNVLHDMLRRERAFLLPQSAFVNVVKQLGMEYEIPVIDLYHAGFLDSHDAAVIYNFMPDGVHGNELGYRMLAEHIAAELIQLSKARQEKAEEALKEAA